MTSKDKEEAPPNLLAVRDQLLKAVKVEVKRLMEEAVTKKFIHEGSSTVTAFCAAVEACLQYGLKKRTVTLFGGSGSQSTFALLERVARSFEPAGRIVKIARETDIAAAASQRLHSNGSVDGSSRNVDSATLPRIFNWPSFTSLSRTASDTPPTNEVNGGRFLARQTSTPPNTPPCSPLLRLAWIRIALAEHVLDQIVQYIAKNALKYYERQSVMGDPCASALLASLLVGPCTLDYTKLKTCDHFLSDPPAEELIQRHRIHSNSLFHSGSLVAQSRFGAAPHSRGASSCGSSKRPSLHIRKKARHASSSSSDDYYSPFGGSLNLSGAAISGAAKDYIEALHQNSRTTLLYGKNNVRVQLKLLDSPLSGYLQVHQTAENSMLLKWTPNQLMNAGVSENGTKAEESPELSAVVESLMHESDGPSTSHTTVNATPERTNVDSVNLNATLESVLPSPIALEASDKSLETHDDVDADDSASAASQRSLIEPSLFWKYALTIPFDDVVYIHCHCHQQPEDHDTVILVGKDGAQYPPFHFPKGGHLLQFLSCIDNGLQQAGGYIDPPLGCDENGIESFPRLRRRSSLLRNDLADAAVSPEVRDYVFRIVHSHVVYQYSDDEDSPALTFTAARPSNGGVETAFTPSSTGVATMTTTSVSPTSAVACDGTSQVAQCKENDNETEDTSVLAANTADCHADLRPDIAGNSVDEPVPESPHDLIRQLCETMRGQLLSRAFSGWLEYTRHIKTVRKHLAELVNAQIVPNDSPCDARRGLTTEVWRRMRPSSVGSKGFALQVPLDEVRRFVYYGGCTPELRRQVWPYLLGHYRPEANAEERETHDKKMRIDYEETIGEWLAIEAIVQQREKEHLEAFLSKKMGAANANAETVSLENDVFDRHQAAGGSSYTSPLHHRGSLSSSPTGSLFSLNNEDGESNFPNKHSSHNSKSAPQPDVGSQGPQVLTPSDAVNNANVVVQVSGDSVAAASSSSTTAAAAPDVNANVDKDASHEKDLLSVHAENDRASESPGMISNSKESLVSPGSPASNGDVYRRALIDDFGMNLHRIDKDVQRCDRNHPYFADPKNLEKLRRIMCSYVWTHLEMGYAQGMCDLVAPLLVVLDDEALTHSCYCRLMERMVSHFPREGTPQAVLDTRFASLRSLVQILDSELFELMQRNGDYTHFFFAYRWFLLDFKRELAYEDVFSVWECIWSAPAVSTQHFVLFLALALVQFYREIIIDNNMDFTDIIRFFNEMAEKHDARQLLWIARYLVYQLQNLIQNC